MRQFTEADPNAIDEGVESEIYQCLNLEHPRSFFLYAGAGSGKTRSLVNAVNRVRQDLRRALLLHGRRLAVITYTNAACDEIKSRLNFDPIVEVSTIHSFAWSLIDGHDEEIRIWLRGNLAAEIQELEAAAAKGRGGKAASDRQRSIAGKTKRITHIEAVRRFVYSPSGDNLGRDSLNHSEVIQMTANFLVNKAALRHILISGFPILFIDESQDTNKHLMDAFLEVQRLHSAKFCLGLFGDMMQRIYADGKPHLDQAIPKEWAFPEKKMNHRCPRRVIDLINQIRRGADGHQQQGRSDKHDGAVRLFILPNELMTSKGIEEQIAHRMAAACGDPRWDSGLGGYKTLILEHHMAARRMGFDAMFDPLYTAFRGNPALLDGSMAGLRLFSHGVLPILVAKQSNDEMGILTAIRNRSPLLSQKTLAAAGMNQLAQLAKAQQAVGNLLLLWEKSEKPSFQAVLNSVFETGLFDIPDSLLPFAGQNPSSDNADDDDDITDSPEGELKAWRKMLESPFDQIRAYVDYTGGTSSFGTHQGIKGLEFPRVLVVISDEEARGFLFSYEKLFGAKEKSKADLAHESKREETTIDRTRRLFYVTCSRAEEGLAIVAYTGNPEAVRQHAISSGWFVENEIEIIRA